MVGTGYALAVHVQHIVFVVDAVDLWVGGGERGVEGVGMCGVMGVGYREVKGYVYC